MRFKFTVEIEIERTQGKFASRDDAIDALTEALEDANPQELTLGDDGEYEVTSWDINEEPDKKPAKSTEKLEEI